MSVVIATHSLKLVERLSKIEDPGFDEAILITTTGCTIDGAITLIEAAMKTVNPSVVYAEGSALLLTLAELHPDTKFISINELLIKAGSSTAG